MARASAMSSNFASKSHGRSCSDVAASVHTTASTTRRLAACAKQIFDKPYRALVDVLKVSERDSHYRLSASRRFKDDEIAALLQSEEGLAFLVALMDQARPRWWAAIQEMAVLGSVAERRRRDMKLLRRAANADEQLTTAFTSSFRIQDEDFYGVVLQGFDAVAAPRASDRAVGKREKR